MGLVATYRIQFINILIPDDDVEDIKYKLVVPSLGYYDSTKNLYFRHQYQNIEGGEIIFNCKNGYDPNGLQKYLKTHGTEKSIAWVIHCGDGPDYDRMCYVTKDKISKYELVEYGFDELSIQLDSADSYWRLKMWFEKTHKNKLQYIFKDETKQIKIKLSENYNYLSNCQLIDQCISENDYILHTYDIDSKENFLEKRSAPIAAKGILENILKNSEYFFEKISLFWNKEKMLEINSNIYLNHFHEREYRVYSPEQWEKTPLEEGFCHESHCSNNSFVNCLNPLYLEWKKNNAIDKIKITTNNV